MNSDKGQPSDCTAEVKLPASALEITQGRDSEDACVKPKTPRRKKTVVHVHNYYAFIGGTEKFECDCFDNITIIIQNSKPYSGPVNSKTHVFTAAEIKKIVKLCEQADLVVLYALDGIKVRLALMLPNRVKIAWRFFGFELYGKLSDLVYSKRSLQYRTDTKTNWLKRSKQMLRRNYARVRYGASGPKALEQAINRTDLMLGLSDEEYQMLKQHWPNLPAFVRLPPRRLEPKQVSLSTNDESSNKKPTIVLGNNRSMYNNHLDIIDMIEEVDNRANYNFVLLFNYGGEGAYTDAVRKAVQGKPYYTLIEEYMPRDEFKRFYEQIDALVINGYRQMAGANIIEALQNGAKVYLNDKNVYLQKLRNEGLMVFTITDLENDLTNGTVKLDQESAEKNMTRLIERSNEYPIDVFQERIYKLC